MTFTITTERLILRDFTPHDVEAYFQQCQDPKYQRFYSDEDCSAEKCAFLVNLFYEQAQQSPRQAYHLAVTDRFTGEFMGIAGLRLENDQQASSGCGLKRTFHHSGLALEAMSALLDFAFNQLNVHRVYAETISKNRPAIKLCRQLGMTQEAEFIENRFFKESWWNTVVLAVRRSQWSPELFKDGQ
ncbi:TPA: N-acetyltransferase [Vibrio vulnificus]|nr:N-acetyltransferase [Vibrio vulnificus]